MAFLLLTFSNFRFAEAKAEVYTEVNTEGGEVYTEIINIVNGKEVKVESDEQGEIKVEVKDGEVKVESDTKSSPTVVITDLDEEEEMTEEEKKEVIEEIETVQEKIITTKLLKTTFFTKK